MKSCIFVIMGGLIMFFSACGEAESHDTQPDRIFAQKETSQVAYTDSLHAFIVDVEKMLAGLPGSLVRGDDDTIDSSVKLNFYYHQLINGNMSDLRLRWITSFERENRLLILLLEYPHTRSYQSCEPREKHWFSYHDYLYLWDKDSKEYQERLEEIKAVHRYGQNFYTQLTSKRKMKTK